MLPSPLGLQRSTALAVDSAIVFLGKPPPSHGREMEGKEKQIPLAPLGRYPHFLSPLPKKTGFFFSFCLGNVIEQNKQVLPPSPPLECSYFRQEDQMREIHTGAGFYGRVMIQKRLFVCFLKILQNRSRSWCPQGAGVAPWRLCHNWSYTATLWWELGLHGNAIFDRSQSRPSRWYQRGTLCSKCTVDLVNLQHQALEETTVFAQICRPPTMQI